MKVISVDNFARESAQDILIAENLSEDGAKNLALELNEKFSGENAPRFYKAVPDGYILSRGMEDLI